MHIKIGEKEIITADTWNDLFTLYGQQEGLRKAMIIAEVISQDTEGGVEPHIELIMKKIEVFKVLTGWTTKNFDALKNSMIYDDAEFGEDAYYAVINQFLKATDGFFTEIKDENDNVLVDMSHTLTTCPYPIFCYTYREKGHKGGTKKVNLFAPKNEMENITFGEFVSLMVQIDKYLNTGNIIEIDKILAMLYRPGKPRTDENLENAYHGDIRLPLVDAAAEVRTMRFKNMAKEARNIMILWLLSCRAMFVKQYAALFNDDTEGESGGSGWAGVVVAMSGGDVTKQQAILNTSVHDVLITQTILEKQRKDAKQ